MTRLDPKKGQYGLRAHEDVRWLLQTEPDVYRYVVQFIAGVAPQAFVDVSGPMPEPDMEAVRRDRNVKPVFPVICLNLKIVTGNLTGDPGVEVTCSEPHYEELRRWRMMAFLYKARAANLARA